MDFDFSTEQQLLKQSAERFIQDRYPFAARRAWADSAEGFSRDNWRRFAELGWLGMSLPEAYGGFGGTPVETMILMQVFGKGLVVEPYLATVVVAAGLVARAGSEEQRQACLPAVASGDLMLAFAFAEPRSRFDLADVRVRAERHAGGWILRGMKSVVLAGPCADKFVVSARTGGGPRERAGISLFLVDARSGELERQDARTLERIPVSELRFNGVKLPPDALLGEEGAAIEVIETVADHAIAALCADAVGAMQVLYEATSAHLKTRKQFGRAIGEFQVLQHRMVDMFVQLEQARSLTYMVTLKLDARRDERRKAASCAKVQIGQAGRFVGSQAVQLHGGMGVTDELMVSHYYKHLMATDILFGNASHHLKLYAALTQERG